MAVAKKTTIAFSLVSIPIAMYTAVQDNDIHFNQLHKDDHQKIKYKKICGNCGQEVSTGDIVKGYQYDDDHFVVVTDDDFEKIKTEKDKTIQILHFANLNQISPVYYDKTYHAIPEAGGDKAFELLRLALMSEQKIAIGKTIIGNHETLLAIIPREDGMLVQTMYYDDDIKEVPKTYNKPALSDTELQMAKTLIQSMDVPFNPEEYKDEYQIKLRELIEQKIAGKEVVQAKSEEQGKIIDIMEALQASLDKNTKTNSIKKSKKTKDVS